MTTQLQLINNVVITIIIIIIIIITYTRDFRLSQRYYQGDCSLKTSLNMDVSVENLGCLNRALWYTCVIGTNKMHTFYVNVLI